MNTLIHIAKIESVPVTSLLDVEKVAAASCRVPGSIVFNEINIHGLVDAKIENQLENHEPVYTVTLTYQTCDRTPQKRNSLAYRLTSIDGTRYLLGSYARPYVIYNDTTPFPGKPGDSVLKTVTLTYKSPHPLLYIVE